jgi:hypothetical protein
MDTGADLLALLGPPSPEKARRLVALLRLMPGQRPAVTPAPRPERAPDAA